MAGKKEGKEGGLGERMWLVMGFYLFFNFPCFYSFLKRHLSGCPFGFDTSLLFSFDGC